MYIYLLAIAFKLWMVVDAARRRADYYWFFIIVLVPFGAWIYFFMVKIHDWNWAKVLAPLKEPSIRELRYQADTNPCVSNKMDLAKALHGKRNYRDALAIYEQIVNESDENKEALYGLAQCKVKTGHYKESIEMFQKVIELDPSYKDYSSWPDLADAFWQGGNRNEAVTLMTELVRIKPRVSHKVIFADYLIRVGRAEEAHPILKQAIDDFNHFPPFAKKVNKKWYRKAKSLQR